MKICFEVQRCGFCVPSCLTLTLLMAHCMQNAERKNERQTQTVKVAQRTIQTVREAATQMERPGIIIDTSEDR